MTTEIVPASARPLVPSTPLPEPVERAGVAARFAWGEFFFAEHHNPHTQLELREEGKRSLWNAYERLAPATAVD